jgi:hypothetical protein
MNEEIFNNLLDAIASLNDKIENTGKNNDGSIKVDVDDLVRTKKAKLKELFSFVKAEFKNYLTDILKNTQSNSNQTNEQLKDSAILAEEGARRVGGRIQNVKLEDINPRVLKMIRDEIIEALGTRDQAEKQEEKKKPNWLLGIIALLAGVLIGIIDFVRDWWKKLKGLLGTLKLTEFLGTVGRFLKNKFLNFIRGVFAFIKNSKLFQILSSYIDDIILKIKNSKFFKTLAGLFSEESFLGKVLKRIRNFFSGEGKAGKVVKTIGSVFSGVQKAFSTIGRGFSAILNAVKTAGSTIWNIIKKSPLFGIGRVIGRLLGPIIAVFDIITNTFNSIKEQGLSFKSVLDGLLGGIVSFFTLGILNFKNIKNLTDKITDAFSEGNIIEGVMRILLSVPDLIFQGIGKITSWLAGFFGGPELKKKVDDFFSGGLTDKLFKLGKTILQTITSPIIKALDYIKQIFGIDIGGWILEMAKKIPGGDWIIKQLSGFKERPDKPLKQEQQQIQQQQPVPEFNKKKDESKGLFDFNFDSLFDNIEANTDSNKELVQKINEQQESNYEVEPNEVIEPTTTYAESNIAMSDKIGNLASILKEQLEVLRETKEYLSNLNANNTNVSAINNNTVIHNQPSSIDMFRRSLLAT